MADNKIAFKSFNVMIGRTFRLSDEQALTSENFGPLLAELTENRVLFLKSLNRSNAALKVGYMLLDSKLHRHESSETLKGRKWIWVNYAPGCHETAASLDDLMLCQVEVVKYDLNEDLVVDDPLVNHEIARFEYKPRAKPKSALPQPVGKAPPAPTETENGWVMI